MTASVSPGVPTTGQGLAVIGDLFRELNVRDVLYCHWKSNEHLDASMIGATDFDLLVDRGSGSEFERIVAEHGFKSFPAVTARRYPGITDWLGLDPATGTLIHLHVHYQLTVGESHLKGYRLPWEHTTLATRVLDPGFGVFVADPHVEVVLLLVRAALKLRWRDLLLGRAARDGVTGGARRELHWLRARVDEARLRAVATSLVGVKAAGLICAMVVSGAPTRRELQALRASCEPALDSYRLFAAGDARRRRWVREARSRIARTRRTAPGVHPSRRLGSRGGTMIALVGADGAGKSSLTTELSRWLGAKLDVATVYGGSGVGTASAARRALRSLARLVRGKASNGSGSKVQRHAVSEDPGARDVGNGSVGNVLRALLIDRERRSRLRDAWRARSRGVIVLSDRFPQSQFPSINDGPRLGELKGARWPLGSAAAREEDTFRFAEAVGPDLVVKLVVPFDVAARRKPDTPSAQLRQKIEIVRRLRFGGRTKVVTVDASAPWDEVLLRVKQCVWDAL